MISGRGMIQVTGLGESRTQAVREELKRLLESAAFRTSKRCRQFLEYVVERTLAGSTEALRERSIGVDLFQLPPDFDTGQHTIVRVTANEVRKKLAQHYLAENGAFHPVRIELPAGSYSAEFKWENPPPVEAAIPRPARWRAGVILAGLAVVVAVAASLPVWRRQPALPASSDSSAQAASLPAAGLPAGADLRLAVGSTSPYQDRNGRTWEPDRFFDGGTVLVRPAQRILRTLDPDIYQRSRQGEFQYDIPLKPGSYELRLHFAETGLVDFVSAESSGEGQRVFRVAANGKPLLEMFDVVADAAGTNISNERVFRDISPAADGFLHLSFTGFRGAAILNGIEVLPVSPGKVRPIRIRAGWTAAWQDSAGQQWRADSYFLGGNALVRTVNPARESMPVPADMALYSSERWGHFSYAIPVAEGRYRVTLKFCEGHYGKRNTGVGGLGSRLFDVYSNGVALLRNFDIFREAGGEGKPLDRSFRGIRPNAQGKILLNFVPVKGMACVNGIEVLDDTK